MVTAISTSNPDQLDDCEIEIIFCGGNAKPSDTHLAVEIVAVDDGIVEWLERRERRKGVKRKPKRIGISTSRLFDRRA
jgi:hypothetical protein